MMKGMTIRDTTHGEPGSTIHIKAGIPVYLTRAANLHPSSPIKWWGTLPSHLFDDPRQNDLVASIQRTIGFVFHADDVRIN